MEGKGVQATVLKLLKYSKSAFRTCYTDSQQFPYFVMQYLQLFTHVCTCTRSVLAFTYPVCGICMLFLWC